ncbi:hypothetical protein FMEAI12_4210006 [Parafrankia sp. Ea1.12]|nr:hypothetical protein FMEAI12_4210006 [Parafrankia sp. Ea1.12]
MISRATPPIHTARLAPPVITTASRTSWVDPSSDSSATAALPSVMAARLNVPDITDSTYFPPDSERMRLSSADHLEPWLLAGSMGHDLPASNYARAADDHAVSRRGGAVHGALPEQSPRHRVQPVRGVRRGPDARDRALRGDGPRHSA